MTRRSSRSEDEDDGGKGVMASNYVCPTFRVQPLAKRQRSKSATCRCRARTGLYEGLLTLTLYSLNKLTNVSIFENPFFDDLHP
jgi:hypothetical protein